MAFNFRITLKWPPSCRSRSWQDIIIRPDLMQTLSEFREIVEEVARMRCKNGKWGMPELYDVKGLTVSFEDKQDAARFAQVMAIESEPVELVESVHNNKSSTIV
jgi:transcriptional regulator of NAD metabolism